MQSERNLLIPSVRFKEAGRAAEFSAYFREVELDLTGVKQVHDRNQRSLLSDANLRVMDAGMGIYSVHLRGFDLSSAERKARDRVLKFCNGIAEFIGPKIAVIHPGRGTLSDLYLNLSYIMGRLDPSLTLVVENMTSDKSVVHSPQTVREFAALAADVPNLGICIDSTHPALGQGPVDSQSYTASVIEHMEAAGNKLYHLHFSDRRDEPGAKHLGIGTGLVLWHEVDSYLSSRAFRGRAAIEVRNAESPSAEISSACAYYGCEESDLKIQKPEPSMVPTAKVSGVEFIAALKQFPRELAGLVSLPERGIVENDGNRSYFLVPTASYQPAHVDPFYVLTGHDDKVIWADYVFGIRRDGKSVTAILIDKERRIGVEMSLGGPGGEWAEFGKAVRQALALASRNPEADHVIVSYLGSERIVMPGEEGAWR